MRTCSRFYTKESSTRHRQELDQGFTLVEILASSVLLVLLFGALAFNFTALRGGSDLDEGVARFETFLRFVRAEAARSGRRIRVEFVRSEKETTAMALPLASPRIVVERAPLERPGVFTAIHDPAWIPPGLDELVGIESTRASEDVELDEDADLAAEYGIDASAFDRDAGSLAALTVYPDGSSDSIEITLASRQQDDERRVRLRVFGITGQVTTEEINDEDFLDETFESFEPTPREGALEFR